MFLRKVAAGRVLPSRRVPAERSAASVTATAFAVVFFLLSFVVPSRGQFRPDTLSVGMYSPSAASLMTYTDYPVSYITGTPEISIPLYTVRSGSLEVPITLSFHMGDYLRSNQSAAPLGAGWSLSSDYVVTRKIKGLDDLRHNGYPETGGSLTAYQDDWNVTRHMASGTVDGEPDRFYFRTLDGTGNFYILPGNRVEQVPSGPEKIEYTSGYTPINEDRFVITDGKGRKYRYGGDSVMGDKVDSEDEHWTGWHCREIVDDKEDCRIGFSYISDFERTVYGVPSGVTVCDSLPVQPPGFPPFDIPRLDTGTRDYPYFLYPNQSGGGGFKWYPDSTRFSKSPNPYPSSVSSRLLSRIDFRGGYVTFTYSVHYRTNGEQQYLDPFRVLDSVKVYSTSSGAPVHTFVFEHNTDMPDAYNVFLTGLVVDGTLHYSFASPSTERGSGAPDFWGYGLYDRDGHPNVIDCDIHIAPGYKSMHYGNNTIVYGSFGPSFYVDNLTSPIYRTGTGESVFEITYPTGGRTSFLYEYDSFYDSGTGLTRKISSKRVKSITFYDTDGTVLKRTEYGYGAGKMIHIPSGHSSSGPVNTVLSQRVDVYNSTTIELPTAYGTVTYYPGRLGYYRKRTFLAGVIFDDEFTTGNWVYYPEVTETVMEGNTPLGKTVYTYDVEGPSGHPQVETFSTELPPYPIGKHYWYMGTPRKTEKYVREAESFSIQERTEYQWETFLKESTIRIARIWPSVQAVDYTADPGMDERIFDSSVYSYQTQDIELGHNRLLRETVTRRLDDGAELVTSREYKYDNPDSMTVNRVITTHPGGLKETEVFVH